jgi:hypothetical protein
MCENISCKLFLGFIVAMDELITVTYENRCPEGHFTGSLQKYCGVCGSEVVMDQVVVATDALNWLMKALRHESAPHITGSEFFDSLCKGKELPVKFASVREFQNSNTSLDTLTAIGFEIMSSKYNPDTSLCIKNYNAENIYNDVVELWKIRTIMGFLDRTIQLFLITCKDDCTESESF